MADFNWYLNRQGARGRQGVKGDQGFSPYFTEEVNTMNEYKLRVQNENDSFVTDNLRGNKIELRNPDGTYIKYDKTTGNFYVDSADYATGEVYGQIRLATMDDVNMFDHETAITPSILSDTLSVYLVNEDGNISIEQRVDGKTGINLNADIKDREGRKYITANNLRTINGNPIHKTTSGDLIAYYLKVNTNHFTFVDSTLELNSSITSKINANSSNISALQSDLSTERTIRGNADTQLQDAIDSERRERETQDSALQSSLNTKLTADNIKAGENITITKDGNNVTINSQGGGSDLQLSEGENIKFTYNQKVLRNADYLVARTVRSFDDLFNEDMAQFDQDSTTTYIKVPSLASDSPSDLVNLTIDNYGSRSDSLKFELMTNKDDPNPFPVFDGIYSNKPSFVHVDGYTLIRITKGNPLMVVITASMSNIRGYLINKSHITINSTGGGGAIIDDETVSTDKVFSSSRTSELVGEVGNDLQDLAQRVNDIESLKVPNVVIVGEPMIQNGQVSDLDEQNHLQFPFVIERKGRIFECNFEFTTGADVTRQQNIIDSRCSVAVAVRNSRIVWALSSNGQTFDVESEVPMNIRPYTTYYCRLYKRAAGSNYGYTLAVGYYEGDDHVSNTITLQDFIYPTTMTIGSDGNSFDGVIDLNKWSLKIDNDLVWLGMDNVGQAVSANVSLSNINEAGVKVINDLIDAKIGDINTILDNINGEVI